MSVLEKERVEQNDPIAHLDFEPSEATQRALARHSIDHLDFPVDSQAIAISEAPEDCEIQQKAARFIGSVATSATFELKAHASRFNSLFEAMQAAYHGDPEALSLVRLNVKTDVVERTIKAGHVIEVAVNVGDNGVSHQSGQSMYSVQANALKFAAKTPQMRARTEAEVTNHFRLEHYQRTGMLEGHSFVVFSCAPDDMTAAEMKQAGFFTDTMSCSIQVTTVRNGKLVTESVFVAGIKQPGGTRHDIRAVRAIAQSFGVDFSNKSVTEMLNSPILVSNENIQNGGVDIAERFDIEVDADSGAGSRATFFGQDQKPKNYITYKTECREREAAFKPKVDAITNEIVRLYPQMRDEVHACQMLNEISGKHMIEQAIFDYSIDPQVFGYLSAEDIYRARRAMEAGEVERGLEYMYRAKQNDQSDSCPGGVSGRTSESRDDDESCTFVSKKCPKCGAKNVLTTVTATKIKGTCGCTASKSKSV